MANAIDQTTDAAGTAEGVDTSITDDAFDDIDISDVPDDGTKYGDDTTTEEKTEETAATESDDAPEEDSADDVEEAATEDVPETTDETDDSPTDEEPSEADKAEAEAADRQKRNEEAAARRIADKQARDAAKAEAQQAFLDEAEDTRDLVLRQLQIDAYNNRVMQVTNTMTGQLNSVVTTHSDLFNHKDETVREAMIAAVDDFEARYVTKDENGDPVAVTGDMNAYLQARADQIRKLTSIGAKQQDQAKQTQKKKTVALPGRSPKQPKVDPDVAAFDEEASHW